MSGVSKVVAEKNHRILLELVAQPGNGTSTRDPSYDFVHGYSQTHVQIATVVHPDGRLTTSEFSSGAFLFVL